MREIWVQSLGWEQPLEKEMETHSSVLAWRIPWVENPMGGEVHGVAKSRTGLSDFTLYMSGKRVPSSTYGPIAFRIYLKEDIMQNELKIKVFYW